MIRALQAEPGVEFSIMDYFDRRGSRGRFFGDGEGMSLPPRPDWMEDVMCWQEGCPDSDLMLLDVAVIPK